MNFTSGCALGKKVFFLKIKSYKMPTDSVVLCFNKTVPLKSFRAPTSFDQPKSCNFAISIRMLHNFAA